MPPGALAQVPAVVRVAAIAAGVVAFVLIRRSVLAGVLVAQAVLTIGATLLAQ